MTMGTCPDMRRVFRGETDVAPEQETKTRDLCYVTRRGVFEGALESTKDPSTAT